MFEKYFNLLWDAAFWFVCFCSLCLAYTGLGVLMGAEVPNSFILTCDIIGLFWCFFAGIVPMLYLGATTIIQWLKSLGTK